MKTIKLFTVKQIDQTANLTSVLKFLLDNIQKSDITLSYSTALTNIAKLLSGNKEFLNGKTGYYFEYDKFLSMLKKIKTDKEAVELYETISSSLVTIRGNAKVHKVYDKIAEYENN